MREAKVLVVRMPGLDRRQGGKREVMPESLVSEAGNEATPGRSVANTKIPTGSSSSPFCVTIGQ